MSKIDVELFCDHEVLPPGSRAKGEVRWDLDTVPPSGEIRLCWYTHGFGDRDAGIAGTKPIEVTAAKGRQAFEFVLPDGPLSFTGKLVSLVWSVELVVGGFRGGSARADFQLGNGERIIDLSMATEEQALAEPSVQAHK